MRASVKKERIGAVLCCDWWMGTGATLICSAQLYGARYA